MKPVRIRPRADADIDGALTYLGKQNPAAAASLLAALERGFQELSRHLGIGSRRYARILPVGGLRMWRVTGFAYLIFYLERQDHLDVVRVLHAARDIPSVRREDPPSHSQVL